jgi:ABC-type multidrug transport system fused ATPase/permease subunit
VLQIIYSLGLHHYFYRSMSTGVLVRGGLITSIHSRSLRLTSRARSTLTNGKLINHISTDVSRIDYCSAFFHIIWTAPIQLIFCLIVLLVNLGPSALVGFAFFVVAIVLQAMTLKSLVGIRDKAMAWTDKRVKLLQELLSGMKVIKLFGWEKPYLSRVYEFRMKEMSCVPIISSYDLARIFIYLFGRCIRSIIFVRSVNNGVALMLPQLAAVLSFITYSLSGHPLNPAIIFSSLASFNLLRMPLTLLRKRLFRD